ncbi:MAG: nucleotidyltransferase domain-containing protein [Candidatus Eisenbacteria sp.]|nr:nucleotidyltransferase domain-containing protein [Candidatus Eisenbacteria bacterium]
MIEALLPQTRRNILALLFARPDEAFYLREIVRITGAGKGAVERELRALSNAGIAVREKRGNLTYYSANPECPIYAELRGLILKTAGLADVLRDSLAQVKGIHIAFVFGSMAAGTADARSDVDLLIVADAPFADISAALLRARERLGRDISPTVYSVEEYEEKLRAGHSFFIRLLEEPKIALIGNPDDLGRVGRSTSR